MVTFETSVYRKKEGKVVGCTVVCCDDTGTEIASIQVLEANAFSELVKTVEELKIGMITEEKLIEKLKPYITIEAVDSKLKAYATKTELKDYATKSDLKGFAKEEEIIELKNLPQVGKRLLMGRLLTDGKGEFEGLYNGYLSLAKGVHSIACKLEGYVQGTDKAEVSILV